MMDDTKLAKGGGFVYNFKLGVTLTQFFTSYYPLQIQDFPGGSTYFITVIFLSNVRTQERRREDGTLPFSKKGDLRRREFPTTDRTFVCHREWSVVCAHGTRTGGSEFLRLFI